MLTAISVTTQANAPNAMWGTTLIPPSPALFNPHAQSPTVRPVPTQMDRSVPPATPFSPYLMTLSAASLQLAVTPRSLVRSLTEPLAGVPTPLSIMELPVWPATLTVWSVPQPLSALPAWLSSS